MCVVNVASYDNYMLIYSYLTFCLFAFFYENLTAIRCISHPVASYIPRIFKQILFIVISRSSQSIKVGIDLTIDKSIKIGKSDLIDIDCIDQSVEIDDTLVLLIDLYRKKHLIICS